MTKDFDRIQSIAKRLKIIFSRDGINHDGEESYIIRAVEEAERLTELAPGISWVCGKCKSMNDELDAKCRHCETAKDGL